MKFRVDTLSRIFLKEDRRLFEGVERDELYNLILAIIYGLTPTYHKCSLKRLHFSFFFFDIYIKSIHQHLWT